MRQPTFLAHAWPRFDHQVYWSGSRLIRRKTSTKPSSSNTRVSHARSSGRNPEFFWLLRQFLRSIGWCAMFQSPQRITSRPASRSRCRCGRNCGEKAELGELALRRARPRRQIDADHGELAEVGLQIAALGVELVAAEAGAHRHRAAGVQGDAAVALSLRGMKRGVRFARRAQRLRHVARRCGLDLLQAHDVPRLDPRRASARVPCAPPSGCR